MKLLKTASNQLRIKSHKILFILQSELDLYYLNKYKNSTKALGQFIKVFKSTKNNEICCEEKEWIEKIATFKNNLDRSNTQISFVDYGAGSPDLKLTPEQTYEGKIVKNTIGGISRHSSKSSKEAFLLFKLIREFKSLVCLELGTCLGVSTIYQGAALEINGKGQISTLEGSESLSQAALNNFKEMNINKITLVTGRFQDTLDNVLGGLPNIDFAFIDGHHEEKATINYYQKILARISNNATLVFDDISWSKGMARAWHEISKRKDVKISFDLFSMGICFCSPFLEKIEKTFKISL